MKEWQLKILNGMILIKEGCQENKTPIACLDCPLIKICDVLGKAYDNGIDVDIPAVWEI